MESQRRDFTLQDADGSDTSFTGWELGVGSSKLHAGQRRWSEVHIYKSVGGSYLVHKIGKSAVPGEVDRPTLHVASAAEGAVESCKSTDKDQAVFFTRVARDALDQAVKLDDELADAFYHRKLA